MKRDEILKESINSGINSETINYIFEKMANNNANKKTNKMIAAIIYMKKRIREQDTEQFYSKIVKNNSSKIKDALKNGITPDEIAMSLIDTLNSPSKKAKKRLNYMVKLITKMKAKELSLKKENTNIKSYQKILTQ